MDKFKLTKRGLYTNGCSWTYGDELDDPKKEVWGYQLTKLLTWNGAYFHWNDALCGVSNEYIIRKTFETVRPYEESGFYFPNIVLCFTTPTRTEVFSNGIYHQIQLSNADYITKDLKDYHEWVVLNSFDPKESVKRLLDNIILLGTFLQKREIPFLFTHAFGADDKKFNDAYTSLKFHETCAWYFGNNYIPTYFNNIVDEGQHEYGPNFHPLKSGHRAWAEYLSEHIQKHNLFKL